MTLYSSSRTTSFQKNVPSMEEMLAMNPKIPDPEYRTYSNFDKYMGKKVTEDRLSDTKEEAGRLSDLTAKSLYGRPGLKGLTLFKTRGGGLIGARDDEAGRSFYVIDMDDENEPVITTAFTLPTDALPPLSALDTDWVDKKTLASYSPLFNALDPATVESIRGMYDYDDAGGKYTIKDAYKRALDAPVWELTGIAAVPGRENAPGIGRMPPSTRVRWKADPAKVVEKEEEVVEVPPEEVPEEKAIEEEPKKGTEPTAKSASELFMAMRGARSKRNTLVEDENGNVDIVKSSTSSLFKTRMRGSR